MPQAKIRRYLRHGTLPQLGVFEAARDWAVSPAPPKNCTWRSRRLRCRSRNSRKPSACRCSSRSAAQCYLTEAGRELHDRMPRDIFACCRDWMKRWTACAALKRAVCGWPSARPASISPRACSPPSSGAPRRRSVPADPQPEGADRTACANNKDDLYIFAEPPEEDVVDPGDPAQPDGGVRTRRPSARRRKRHPVRAHRRRNHS